MVSALKVNNQAQADKTFPTMSQGIRKGTRIRTAAFAAVADTQKMMLKAHYIQSNENFKRNDIRNR
jgi:hypothetical protein